MLQQVRCETDPESDGGDKNSINSRTLALRKEEGVVAE
jgi:hypothetical protein